MTAMTTPAFAWRADLIMATQRVYCIPSLPSRIVLPIVP